MEGTFLNFPFSAQRTQGGVHLFFSSSAYTAGAWGLPSKVIKPHHGTPPPRIKIQGFKPGLNL